jgi:cytoskeletal protein RodZ
VSIGQALAEAREQAGLTVSQVSQRTRIRETIIRGIEHDDYSSCGGDFYARGHIRAIARVVEADPVPLIREYDTEVAVPDELDEQDELQPAPGPVADRVWPTPIRISERPRMNWSVLLAVALLAAVGLLIYHFAAGSGHATGAAGKSSSSRHAQHGGSGVRHPSASPSATASASVPPARRLAPASASAFGPTGGQGDNAAEAPLAIDSSTATAWHTDWYTTAHFSGEQAGTGLLLDMGKPVTVSSVTLILGSTPGADLQLRAGNAATPGALTPVARATDASGTVRMGLASPRTARYLLIWFTKLPPDSAGTYQAYVYNVTVMGSS